MRKHVLVLTTSVAILILGALAASSQQPPLITPSPGGAAPNLQPPSAAAPVPKPSSVTGPIPQPPSAASPFLKPSSGRYPPGMMGPGRDLGMMGSMPMRMMFALMDADGDGKLSLQEWQAAQERIFKAMDSNKDGFVTLEEMQNFMRGTGRPFPLRRE